MRITTRVAAGAMAAAMLATSISPAMARHDRGWGGWGRSHHRHHDRIDAGDIFAGIFVIGAIAAIASSASKAKRDRAETRDRDPDWDRDRDRPIERGGISSENQAVDACAEAAEDKAGQRASVREITEVARTPDGWDVEGRIETRDSWRQQSGKTDAFTCSVRGGRVETVYIEGENLALAE
jgi:hypothetical protein